MPIIISSGICILGSTWFVPIQKQHLQDLCRNALPPPACSMTNTCYIPHFMSHFQLRIQLICSCTVSNGKGPNTDKSFSRSQPKRDCRTQCGDGAVGVGFLITSNMVGWRVLLNLGSFAFSSVLFSWDLGVAFHNCYLNNWNHSCSKSCSTVDINNHYKQGKSELTQSSTLQLLLLWPWLFNLNNIEYLTSKCLNLSLKRDWSKMGNNGTVVSLNLWPADPIEIF